MQRKTSSEEITNKIVSENGTSSSRSYLVRNQLSPIQMKKSEPESESYPLAAKLTCFKSKLAYYKEKP